MNEPEQATKEDSQANVPVHVDGARRGEEMAQHEGKEPDQVDLGEAGAGRPVGGHAAFDPMRTGQDEEGMKERGTVDPGAPDPSGGPA